MDNKNICRLCAIVVNASSSLNLFRRCRKRLLQQITGLIGLQLEYAEDLPHLVCVTCLKQIEQAHDFRERCIQVQQQFTTAIYLSQIKEYHYENEEEFLQEINITTEMFTKEEEEVNEQEAGEVDEQEYDELIKQVDEEVNEQEDEEEDENELEDKEVHEQEDEEMNDEEGEEVSLLPIIEVLIEQENTDDNTTSIDDYWHDSEVDLENEKTMNGKRQKLSITEVRARRNLKRRSQKFICNYCGNSYTDRTNFLNHQLRHGEKQLECEVCSKKFFTKPEVRSHMRVHTGEKPYACRYCDKCFSSCNNRGLHERTHTNERPFPCQQCGKTFKSSKDLNDHLLTHSDRRPFECGICNVSFAVKKYLRQHNRSTTHKMNEENYKILINAEF